MLPRFGIGLQFFADERQVVWRVRIDGIQPDRLPQVLARRVHIPGFIQHAAQIEMRQGVFRIEYQGLAEIFRSLFQVSIFVVKACRN